LRLGILELGLSNAADGPAMANISFPAAAMALAPKTGEAMNCAPLLDKVSEALDEVSG